MVTFIILLLALIIPFVQASSATLGQDSLSSRQDMMDATASPMASMTMMPTPTVHILPPSDDMTEMTTAGPEEDDEGPYGTEEPMMSPTITPSITPRPQLQSPAVPNAYMSCRCIEEGRQCTEYMANRSTVCSASTPRNFQAPGCYWNCCLLCMINKDSEACQKQSVLRLCAQQFIN